MNKNKNDDLIDQLNRLLEWLHQSDGQHLGSHITLIKVEKGAQYVNHIGSQVFNTDKSDVSAKDHSPTIEPPELPELPEPLATPEAMVLWQKAQQAELVDDYYQPLISNTQSALLANEMSKILKIRNKWKVYEKFWGRRKMYQDYYKAFNQKQSIGFQEELKKLFG